MGANVKEHFPVPSEAVLLVSVGEGGSGEQGELCRMKVPSPVCETPYVAFASRALGQQLLDGHPGRISLALKAFDDCTATQKASLESHFVILFTDPSQVTKYLSDFREGKAFSLEKLVVQFMRINSDSKNAP